MKFTIFQISKKFKQKNQSSRTGFPEVSGILFFYNFGDAYDFTILQNGYQVKSIGIFF